MEIIYNKENIELFKKFLESNDNIKHYYNEYKDKLKEFFEIEMQIHINVYFQRVDYKTKYFFIIETPYEFYSSDDIHSSYMRDYNIALNKAINYIFIKILNVVKV